jgi:hypothetical protein
LFQWPDLNGTLLGIESDKTRAEQAPALFANGTVLWSAIEDATVDQPVSLLWFTPAYDCIQGAGRTEVALFNRVKEWPARGTGLLAIIAPDFLFADAEVGLATTVERDFELLGLGAMAMTIYRFGRFVRQKLTSALLGLNAATNVPRHNVVLADIGTWILIATHADTICKTRPKL